MSLVSRSVPIRYEPDFWPSRYDRRFPIYQDPFPYSTRFPSYNDLVPYNFENRPLTANRMWSSFENEMARMSDEMKRTWDRTCRNVAPWSDDWRLADDMSRKMMDDMKIQERSLLAPSVDNWRLMENFRMDNPITEDLSGQRKFYLEYDMSQFKPEEIMVKTSGHQLSVHAKHEEKDDNRSSRREYARTYLLPPEVNSEMLISKLSDSGKLTIEAPLPALPVANKDRLIPIEHKK